MATALEPSGLRATPSVYVASLDSPDTTLLTHMHSRMTYASPGYLVFVQDGALLAQTFDPVKLRLTGEPVRIAEGLAYCQNTRKRRLHPVGQRDAGVSRQWGCLADPVVRPTTEVSRTPHGRSKITVRCGSRETVKSVRRGLSRPTDWRGRYLDFRHVQRHACSIHVRSGRRERSVWSPDDSRILFRTVRGGPESLRMGSAAPNLHAKALATGTGRTAGVRSKSTGNKRLVSGRPMDRLHKEHQTDGHGFVADAGARRYKVPTPSRTSDLKNSALSFSPDSRWMAFVSTESGPPESIRRTRPASQANENAFRRAAAPRRVGVAMAGSCFTRPQITAQSCRCGSRLAPRSPPVYRRACSRLASCRQHATIGETRSTTCRRAASVFW